MNPQDADSRRAAKTYCPFWALVLLFLTLIGLQTMYLIEDLKQRSQIQATRTQMKNVIGSAQTISQTTEAVGRELVALSTNSEEALKIITEFKIQLNTPPTPPK